MLDRKCHTVPIRCPKHEDIHLKVLEPALYLYIQLVETHQSRDSSVSRFGSFSEMWLIVLVYIYPAIYIYICIYH